MFGMHFTPTKYKLLQDWIHLKSKLVFEGCSLWKFFAVGAFTFHQPVAKRLDAFVYSDVAMGFFSLMHLRHRRDIRLWTGLWLSFYCITKTNLVMSFRNMAIGNKDKRRLRV